MLLMSITRLDSDVINQKHKVFISHPALVHILQTTQITTVESNIINILAFPLGVATLLAFYPLL